jgi:hypothetical protein
MKTSQKGFIGIILIIIIALAVGASVTYYMIESDKDHSTNTNENQIKTSSSDEVLNLQQPAGVQNQPQSVEKKQDREISPDVTATDTHTSEMGFAIKSPRGWLAMDEMAGHYTISQTEAAGWKQGSNLEISISKTDAPQKVEPGFVYCGDELMTVAIEKLRTDLVRICKGSVMRGLVWHNGYSFIANSTQVNGNHDADMKIFADVVSSFTTKK